MECIEKSKLSDQGKYGATGQESKLYLHSFVITCPGIIVQRLSSQLAARAVARCSCGLMPRTRLKAALNAKGVE